MKSKLQTNAQPNVPFKRSKTNCAVNINGRNVHCAVKKLLKNNSACFSRAANDSVAKLQFCFWLFAESTVGLFPCLATHRQRCESFSLLFFFIFSRFGIRWKNTLKKTKWITTANMCARARANETMFTCVKYDNGARATSNQKKKQPHSTGDLSLRFISAHTCCMHRMQMVRGATEGAVKVEFHFQREKKRTHAKKYINVMKFIYFSLQFVLLSLFISFVISYVYFPFVIFFPVFHSQPFHFSAHISQLIILRAFHLSFHTMCNNCIC